LSSNNKKVLIITVVHPPFDPRIYYKEAISLAENGFNVTLIAPAEFKENQVNGIKTIGLPKYKNRYKRIFNCARVTYYAIKGRFDFYHFHDPEFLIWSVLIKLFTFRPVIYDVHEDYPNLMLHKDYVNPKLRKMVKFFVNIYECMLGFIMDYIIVADKRIDERFKKINNYRIILSNYPRIRNFKLVETHKANKRIIYAGGISKVRGAEIMLDAIDLTKKSFPNVQLYLVGKPEEKGYDNYLKDLIVEKNLADNVKIEGMVPYEDSIVHIQSSSIGLSISQDISPFNENVPTKIFEYMACGIPVIASDLPTVREYIINGKSGLLVNPDSPQELTDAIRYLLENPEVCARMGEKGRKLVLEKYNWESMEARLLKVYSLIENREK